MRVAVCHPQVPFDRGGAEVLADTLVQELGARGHEADLVTVPFKWYPPERIVTNALAWRLLDLDESLGRPIDLVIATKFPSYAVRHANKVVWLVHQFRQAYELDSTDMREFGDDPAHRALRRTIHRLDDRTLGEARRLFAISRNVADRLRRNNGLEAQVLTPPPQPLGYRAGEYGDYVLSVGRLDRAKRVDLLVRAAAATNGLRVVVAGDGPDRARLEELARAEGVAARVTFAGRVAERELTELYAGCLAVFYAPIDEDFGMVPYEAFLSGKPVVTTTDAGGPLEVVTDRRTGLVCEPRAAALAEACSWLRAHVDDAKAWGRAGKEIARRVSWDETISRLLA
jgi:glycosyltransferase involved in cell wall biosynthesis